MDKIILDRFCKVYNEGKDIVIFQPVGELEIIEEYEKLNATVVCFKVDNWGDDLSPWSAPAVFKGPDFGGMGNTTLVWLKQIVGLFPGKKYIGGYSLAGLFSLWALTEIDEFDGAFSCSGSLWFPGWLEYLKNKRIENKCIYLSLGDKEALTKNKVMATVSKCTQTTYDYFSEGNACVYEMNEGGHFNDPEGRVIKGIEWIINGANQ